MLSTCLKHAIMMLRYHDFEMAILGTTLTFCSPILCALRLPVLKAVVTVEACRMLNQLGKSRHAIPLRSILKIPLNIFCKSRCLRSIVAVRFGNILTTISIDMHSCLSLSSEFMQFLDTRKIVDKVSSYTQLPSCS